MDGKWQLYVIFSIPVILVAVIIFLAIKLKEK